LVLTTSDGPSGSQPSASVRD